VAHLVVLNPRDPRYRTRTIHFSLNRDGTSAQRRITKYRGNPQRRQALPRQPLDFDELSRGAASRGGCACPDANDPRLSPSYCLPFGW